MRTLFVPLCRLLIVTVGLFLPGKNASAQPNKSPSEIIASISNREGLWPLRFFSCGISTEDEQDRSLAEQLTREGSLATSQLEQVFDSLQSRGTESPYFQRPDWFFLAYAS